MYWRKVCIIFYETIGKKCPHCGSEEKPMTVLLKLSMDRVPLSLLQTVSKMSFTVQKKTKKSDLILRRTDVVTYKLPNGNIISSEGLPEGLTDENLEAVIAAVEDKDKLKVNPINIIEYLNNFSDFMSVCPSFHPSVPPLALYSYWHYLMSQR